MGRSERLRSKPALLNSRVDIPAIANRPDCDVSTFDLVDHPVIADTDFPKTSERLAQSDAVVGGSDGQPPFKRPKDPGPQVQRDLLEVIPNHFPDFNVVLQDRSRNPKAALGFGQRITLFGNLSSLLNKGLKGGILNELKGP